MNLDNNIIAIVHIFHPHNILTKHLFVDSNSAIGNPILNIIKPIFLIQASISAHNSLIVWQKIILNSKGSTRTCFYINIYLMHTHGKLIYKICRVFCINESRIQPIYFYILIVQIGMIQ